MRPRDLFRTHLCDVRYKAEGHKYRLTSEEVFWEQGRWLQHSKLKLLLLKREILGQRKEIHPLENKVEFHHGYLDPRTLPKKHISL